MKDGKGLYQEGNDDCSDAKTRAGILAQVDDFILQILSIRKVILLIFASSVILGPPSIILSFYLFTHPSFDKTVDAEDNFGEVLAVLLVSTVIVASSFLVLGVKQYRSIGSWDKRFKDCLEAQRELDRKIIADYGMSIAEND
jgi:hypothetical protein